MQDCLKAYSIKRVAELIGSGRDGVYGAIRSGRLKAKKFGKRTLILESDLTDFLQSLPALELSPPERHPSQKSTEPAIRSRRGGRRQ